tara:strand:- start:52 stop:624 length:573 start_codon:yes stop_codon:yes gene_type:complete
MLNSKVRYVIIINLSGKIKRKTIYIWNELQKTYSIKYIASRSPCPHIALVSSFIIDNKRFFKIKFRELCKNIESFEIYTRGLGIFIQDTPVIHIRWRQNKKLRRLKKTVHRFLQNMQNEKIIRDYVNDEDWIPKTTLAYKDSSYDLLKNIISTSKQTIIDDSMMVENLNLYELSLKYGEKDIYQVSLKVK